MMSSRFKQKVKNVVRGLAQKWANTGVKRHMWNKEFREGRWDYLEKTSGDLVYESLEKYCRKGHILDLGCGSGNTGNELRADIYEGYMGVDISDVAVKRARDRSIAAQRQNKNSYSQSDISTYVPEHAYDVILFRESIFYIAGPKVLGTLQRYAKCLNDDGVLIVRMCDRIKYGDIVETIQNHFSVVETSEVKDSKAILLVFR